MVNTVDINVDSNFWEHYPNFKMANPFKKLYTSDKSKNKTISSKKMWCIALIYDRSSMYYNLPEHTSDREGKVDIIIGDNDLTPWYKQMGDEFFALRDMYIKLTETVSMRSLRELEEKLDERSKFLKETKYDLGIPNERGQMVGGTADILEKMFSNTQKVFETVEKTRALVNQEKSSSTKGDVTESLSDKAEI